MRLTISKSRSRVESDFHLAQDAWRDRYPTPSERDRAERRAAVLAEIAETERMWAERDRRDALPEAERIAEQRALYTPTPEQEAEYAELDRRLAEKRAAALKERWALYDMDPPDDEPWEVSYAQFTLAMDAWDQQNQWFHQKPARSCKQIAWDETGGAKRLRAEWRTAEIERLRRLRLAELTLEIHELEKGI